MLDGGHQGFDCIPVTIKAVEVEHAMHPMQSPIGDGDATIGFNVATNAHGQNAIVTGRIAQCEKVPRQPPIEIGGQVYHLVDNAIAHPSALLAGGAIGKSVLRIKLNGANASRVEAVQLLIAATEIGSCLPGVDMFAASKVGEFDLSNCAMHYDIGITKAIGVK